ncbi:MAG: hypothetical protein IPO92_11370 [Saprospiraceae bacterium]|nr:hypothetical protein [Saprospiraceae bacterium]
MSSVKNYLNYFFSIIFFLIFCEAGISQTKHDSLKYEVFLSQGSFKPNYSFTTYYNNLTSKKFNAADLPVFCRIEHLIESKSNIGFRFRLGDLNYVNMLENKK